VWDENICSGCGASPGVMHDDDCPVYRDRLRASQNGGGAWVAYYSDRSGAYVFASEIEALRKAVESSMQVRFVKWGEDLFVPMTRDDRSEMP
jgi:hypothetical protein